MKLKNKYICLSERDKIELSKWIKFKQNKQKVNIKKKASIKSKLDIMADSLKGKSYLHFLQSEYWSIVRRRVIARDKMCLICKSKYNLQVHHDTYKNHFREHCHLEDLMTLCKCCHKEHHYCS